MGEDIEYGGLAFFGKVTASISHEIKNRMAIINEQAGLLEDFVLMAERGQQIDLARLKRLAGAVKEQVALGDRVLRNMNRFAHSVDAPRAAVDLHALLALTAALAARPAGLKGAQLKVQPCSEKVEATTSPFLMTNLIWLCIDSALEAAGSGSTLVLSCKKQAGAAAVSIRGEAEGSGGAAAPPDRVHALAAALGAEVAPADGGGIEIRTPTGIET